MNLRRLFELMVTDVNSPRGLVIRAEKMEEDAEKVDGPVRRHYLLYARVLRELALKDFSPVQNKAFIRNYLRGASP